MKAVGSTSVSEWGRGEQACSPIQGRQPLEEPNRGGPQWRSLVGIWGRPGEARVPERTPILQAVCMPVAEHCCQVVV